MKNFKKYILILLLLFSITSLYGCVFDKLMCDHDYVETVVEPTCTGAGFRKYTCSKCGDEKVELLPALGHDYTEWVIEKEATCKDPGIKTRTCKRCGETFSEEIISEDHDYVTTTVEPTCETEGYTLNKCKICGKETKTDIVPALGHNFGEWKVIKEATVKEDGIEERVCSRCNHTEQRPIQFKSYVDTSILDTKYDFNNEILVNSIEELQVPFDSCLLNNIREVTFKLPFAPANISKIRDDLLANTSIDKSVRVGVSGISKKLKFTFEYKVTDPTKKASETDAYQQLSSLNANTITQTRPNDFDDFKINHAKHSYPVTTSEQLFYVLERGYLPLPTFQSRAEVIYNEAKAVLRKIINDDMTDLEKMKAIHDYIILSTTYDDALLKLAYQNITDIHSYNGFYLEGVFLDHRAVCDGISKAVTVLANMEGIPCIQIEGKQADNPNGVGHAWNKVYIDNNWYIFDATSDGTVVNSEIEILSYEFFLISEDTMSMHYVGSNYNNIKCDKTYNIYKDMNFIHKNQTNDFVIDNMKELKVLVSYANTFKDNKDFSLQFYITFDYGTSIGDEISEACLSQLITNNFSYISHGNIVTLIK